MDQNARQQIIDRLKEANNVLVTVSANPSVDQLAACIGITLLLNKLGKHGTAVFSGQVPSTIEFLKPDATLEKNTDSLRDFIIALDKSKADKLRYKVEDKIVKIFITPYRTSLSDKDLEFSQGDFNVDAVLALGVRERTELDQAITAHGRILHDATVISVNNKNQGELGAINWVDPQASSLSEMLVEVAHGLSQDKMDGQMATAFMTGIVAETARFSNPKTTPRTMALASELMAAGANQQLIASKLESPSPEPSTDKPSTDAPTDKPAESSDGSLQIEHEQKSDNKDASPEDKKPDEPPAKDDGDDVSSLLSGLSNDSGPTLSHSSIGSPRSMAWQPPALGGQLTANSQPEHLQTEPSTDPLSLPTVTGATFSPPPILNRPADLSGKPIQPAVNLPGPDKPNVDTTLSGLEASVSSPHLHQNDTVEPEPPKGEETLEEAREAVDQAIAGQVPTQPLEPIQALGAQPVDLGTPPPPEQPLPTPTPVTPTTPVAPDPPGLEPSPSVPPSPITFPSSLPDPTVPQMPPTPVTPPPPPFGAPPDNNGVNPNIPNSLLPSTPPTDTTGTVDNPTAPPPVPPPMLPPA